MARNKLRCWIGNYDGRRNALVIATTKKRAKELLNVGTTTFEGYFNEQRDVPIGFAIETLYLRSMAVVDGAWPGDVSTWEKREPVSAPRATTRFDR